MKKAQFDIDDVVAIWLWIFIILLFVVILNMGGCNRGFSKATIASEKEETIDSTLSLLSYLNTEVEYGNRDAKISELISEIYTSQDPSKKDVILRLVNEKTKEIFGSKTCWTLNVLANPRIEIESESCKERTALEEKKSRAKITTKIPTGTGMLEIEYQTYVFRLKEIAGKH